MNSFHAQWLGLQQASSHAAHSCLAGLLMCVRSSSHVCCSHVCSHTLHVHLARDEQVDSVLSHHDFTVIAAMFIAETCLKGNGSKLYHLTRLCVSHAAATLTAQYNNLDSVREVFAANKGEIAGVILEPVVGNSGYIAPNQEFLQVMPPASGLLILRFILAFIATFPGIMVLARACCSCSVFRAAIK